MTTLKQELMEKISHLDEDQQRRVLEFIENLEAAITHGPPYTAQELMRLPFEERQKAVTAAFAAAADEGFEIFEAFGDEDLIEY